MSTITNRPEWLLVGLAFVIVICATVLSATSNVIPTWFPDLAFAALGAGGGVALPKIIGTTTPAAPVTAAPSVPAQPLPAP